MYSTAGLYTAFYIGKTPRCCLRFLSTVSLIDLLILSLLSLPSHFLFKRVPSRTKLSLSLYHQLSLSLFFLLLFKICVCLIQILDSSFSLDKPSSTPDSFIWYEKSSSNSPNSTRTQKKKNLLHSISLSTPPAIDRYNLWNLLFPLLIVTYIYTHIHTNLHYLLSTIYETHSFIQRKKKKQQS